MTTRMELGDDIVRWLESEARARGVGLEIYAKSLLEEAIASRATAQGVLSIKELHAMQNALAEGSDKLPQLPTSAFARESFYENRP